MSCNTEDLSAPGQESALVCTNHLCGFGAADALERLRNAIMQLPEMRGLCIIEERPSLLWVCWETFDGPSREDWRAHSEQHEAVLRAWFVSHSGEVVPADEFCAGLATGDLDGALSGGCREAASITRVNAAQSNPRSTEMNK